MNLCSSCFKTFSKNIKGNSLNRKAEQYQNDQGQTAADSEAD